MFPAFPSMQSRIPTYKVLKWVVNIWLIVFQVHVFSIPWQGYNFVGRMQGVLSSNITPNSSRLFLALKLVWPYEGNPEEPWGRQQTWKALYQRTNNQLRAVQVETGTFRDYKTRLTTRFKSHKEMYSKWLLDVLFTDSYSKELAWPLKSFVLGQDYYMGTEITHILAPSL